MPFVTQRWEPPFVSESRSWSLTDVIDTSCLWDILEGFSVSRTYTQIKEIYPEIIV